MNLSTEQLTISIPITQINRDKAEQFAREQPNSEKAKQVYYNTLAVLVTHNYLQMLDIPTSLQQSHSWNAIARISNDIADLSLPEKGHLECRPILAGDENCYFPQDSGNNPIGYVVIELDKTCKQGKLLGFTPQVHSTKLDIKELQSLDNLLITLHQKQTVVELHQWLENIIDTGWKNIEEIIDKQAINPLFVFADLSADIPDDEKTKNAVAQLYASQNQVVKLNSDSETALMNLLEKTDNEEIRWKAAELLWEINPENPAGGIRKAIDLGMHFGQNAIALMVAILPKSDETMAILIRLYPGNNKTHLPSGLELSGLDAAGNSFFTVQSRSKDNYIQFKFTAELGDKFNIKVALEDTNITEYFVV